MSTVFEKSLKLHETHSGKIEVISKVAVTNKDELSLAYSPGVAAPCLAIKENVENVYKYTSKGNMVAVVTDGSAVLGLGNIGPEAALPVMEGKAILFKQFADVDALEVKLFELVGRMANKEDFSLNAKETTRINNNLEAKVHSGRVYGFEGLFEKK